MCVCHGSPGAEGQNMLGRVEQRQDGASCLGKGRGRGSVELKNLRRLNPCGRALFSQRTRGTHLGCSYGPTPSGWGPALLATCSKILDMRSNSIRKK